MSALTAAVVSRRYVLPSLRKSVLAPRKWTLVFRSARPEDRSWPTTEAHPSHLEVLPIFTALVGKCLCRSIEESTTETVQLQLAKLRPRLGVLLLEYQLKYPRIIPCFETSENFFDNDQSGDFLLVKRLCDDGEPRAGWHYPVNLVSPFHDHQSPSLLLLQLGVSDMFSPGKKRRQSAS